MTLPVWQPPAGTFDHHQTGHQRTKSARSYGTAPVAIGASVRSSLDTPGGSSIVAWVFRLDYVGEGQVSPALSASGLPSRGSLSPGPGLPTVDSGS
ncbi:hypothetical protein PG996_011796 [Apiospora saccharicola]|uniref:Uncharacterized protein n=1 Tax=Apiospora saccharicola TaxID=335842 RepID=A0ABR1UJ23_9PEZI